MVAQTTQSCAVVGVGNILMGDDGVGVHVVRELARSGRIEAGLFDAGTALSEVLFELEGFRKLVIVDCLRAGGRPGAIYRADLDDLLRSPDSAPTTSLHQYSVVPALRDALLAGIDLADVVLIGIEPAGVQRRLGLSPELSRRMSVIVRCVLDEMVGVENEHP